MPQPKKSKLRNIEFSIDGNGDITIGQAGTIRCAATAADEDQQLAALARKGTGHLPRAKLLISLKGAAIS